MTVRKLLVLAATAVLLVAAVSLARIDWFGLGDYEVHEDAPAWGLAGFALFVLSTYPAPWMDRRYGDG